MPLVVERMVAGVVLGALAPVSLAIAAAGDGLRLEPFDFGFAFITFGAVAWGLRRQLRRRIAAAPEAAPDARLATARATVWRELRIFLAPAALVALMAESGGGAEALICGAAAILMVWNALDLRSWERRTGAGIYRNPRLWARGAPFFHLVRRAPLRGSTAP